MTHAIALRVGGGCGEGYGQGTFEPITAFMYVGTNNGQVKMLLQQVKVNVKDIISLHAPHIVYE